ncbi:hypothetical protein B9Z39_15905 [Limnohabitans sp. JirII-29]|uniref:OB-fold protein n=1 Tax=Limnohabitans sp. JirII-29 TaxID=1835756 RepID=UPI000D3C2EFC|nr:hypothetical protein [Limnohabitans sp. JirII-29]PUE23231.1 hypothetical protein B9Z39_15905 [Limnohabitans sp. JirII-29]
MSRYLLVAFFTFIFFTFLGKSSTDKSTESKDNSNAPNILPLSKSVMQEEVNDATKNYQLKMPLPIRVDAWEYQVEYQKNEIFADSKYKEKALRVNGVFYSASRNIDGDPVLLLFGIGGAPGVAAYMRKSEEPKIATLIYGQNITLRCGGAGKIAGIPALGPCWFYKGELANEIRAAEEALARQSIENRLISSPEMVASESTQ